MIHFVCNLCQAVSSDTAADISSLRHGGMFRHLLFSWQTAVLFCERWPKGLYVTRILISQSFSTKLQPIMVFLVEFSCLIDITVGLLLGCCLLDSFLFVLVCKEARTKVQYSYNSSHSLMVGQGLNGDPDIGRCRSNLLSVLQTGSVVSFSYRNHLCSSRQPKWWKKCLLLLPTMLILLTKCQRRKSWLVWWRSPYPNNW